MNISQANAGVQFLAGLVGASKNYLFYAGADAREAASYFKVSGNYTTQSLESIFNRGSLVGTPGRGEPEPANLPNGEPIWAAIAVNTSAGYEQSPDLSENLRGMGTKTPFNIDVVSALVSGGGQEVKPVSLFIHEGAERQKFAEIGVNHPFFGYGKNRQFDTYGIAHNFAKQREAVIRRELRITGGFAGGSLQTRTRSNR